MNSSRPDIITILEETLDNLELGTVTSLSLVKVLWNYQTIEFKFDNRNTQVEGSERQKTFPRLYFTLGSSRRMDMDSSIED